MKNAQILPQKGEEWPDLKQHPHPKTNCTTVFPGATAAPEQTS